MDYTRNRKYENWDENYDSNQEHKIMKRWAREWYKKKHNIPEKQGINITEAHEEFCLHIDREKDCLKKISKWDAVRVAKTISTYSEVCPLCGNKLQIQILSMCNKINPKRYTALIVCPEDKEGEEWDGSKECCPYYAFVKTPQIDVFNAIESGDYSLLEKVEVENE